jgi:hypothetical protein
MQILSCLGVSAVGPVGSTGSSFFPASPFATSSRQAR